jgi:hypothetical protein
MINEFIQISILVLAQYALPVPHIEFTDDPDVLGGKETLGITMCGFGKQSGKPMCYIMLNSCIEEEGRTDLSDKILKHELAHYIDFMTDGMMSDHGGQWTFIMNSMGLKPRQYARRTDTPRSCR